MATMPLADYRSYIINRKIRIPTVQLLYAHEHAIHQAFLLTLKSKNSVNIGELTTLAKEDFMQGIHSWRQRTVIFSLFFVWRNLFRSNRNELLLIRI